MRSCSSGVASPDRYRSSSCQSISLIGCALVLSGGHLDLLTDESFEGGEIPTAGGGRLADLGEDLAQALDGPADVDGDRLG